MHLYRAAIYNSSGSSRQYHRANFWLETFIFGWSNLFTTMTTTTTTKSCCCCFMLPKRRKATGSNNNNVQQRIIIEWSTYVWLVCGNCRRDFYFKVDHRQKGNYQNLLNAMFAKYDSDRIYCLVMFPLTLSYPNSHPFTGRVNSLLLMV